MSSASRKSKRAEPTPVARAYRSVLRAFGKHKNVTAIDIGPRDASDHDGSCVRIHALDLAVAQDFPESVEGIPVSVRCAAYVRQNGQSLLAPSSHHDTLRPGISLGSLGTYPGTLGLIVYDALTHEPCVLSAGHVLVSAFPRVGDAVYQPAPGDRGVRDEYRVADLLRFYRAGPWGDAALAKLNGSRPFASETFASNVRISATNVPKLHQVLEKSGRTTGVTRGRVDGFGRYRYPGCPTGVDGFLLKLSQPDGPLEELTAPGDSGAVWYEPEDQLGYGLHCAGEINDPSNEWAVACYLSKVLATLQATLQP